MNLGSGSRKQIKLSEKQADAVLALASVRMVLVKYAAGKCQLSEELVENIAFVPRKWTGSSRFPRRRRSRPS
jgi:hypothetical protein